MKIPTWVRVLLVVGLVVAVAVWGIPDMGSGSDPASDEPAAAEPVADEPASGGSGEEWFVEHVVDGDTLEVSRGGVDETVRMIGIDTPERDECGYTDARSAMEDLVEGRTVTLVPGAVTDRDDYDRMLRYVEIEGVDAGLWMLENGYAAEVYDSRRGKPHDREDEYIAVDEAAPDLCEFDAG